VRPDYLKSAFGVSRDALYRHARAFGLLSKRRKNLPVALDHIIDRAEWVHINGSTVISAIKLLAQWEGVGRVTLTNLGSTALSITSITITGTDSGDFSQTNTCGSSVGAGQNCSISVTFTPLATGSRTASVSVTDNGGGSPQTASLSGTGS
jgi:hypothetical protein